MNPIESAGKIYPLGEGYVSFPTAGSWVKFLATDDELTPDGGLERWGA